MGRPCVQPWGEFCPTVPPKSQLQAQRQATAGTAVVNLMRNSPQYRHGPIRAHAALILFAPHLALFPEHVPSPLQIGESCMSGFQRRYYPMLFIDPIKKTVPSFSEDGKKYLHLDGHWHDRARCKASNPLAIAITTFHTHPCMALRAGDKYQRKTSRIGSLSTQSRGWSHDQDQAISTVVPLCLGNKLRGRYWPGYQTTTQHALLPSCWRAEARGF